MKVWIKTPRVGMIPIVGLECTVECHQTGHTQLLVVDRGVNLKYARGILSVKTISSAGIQTESIVRMIERHACHSSHKLMAPNLDGKHLMMMNQHRKTS